jgi:hypothetical protein
MYNIDYIYIYTKYIFDPSLCRISTGLGPGFQQIQVKRAHNAIKHLADYVLVWGGGQ